MLNESKSITKQKQLIFMGHNITADGVCPDDSKVEAINKMPTPTDAQAVKRFCGMVQYVGKFIPNLASDIEPLRKLLRKDNPWQWTDECDKAFESLKSKLTVAPVLSYFMAILRRTLLA